MAERLRTTGMPSSISWSYEPVQNDFTNYIISLDGTGTSLPYGSVMCNWWGP